MGKASSCNLYESKGFKRDLELSRFFYICYFFLLALL